MGGGGGYREGKGVGGWRDQARVGMRGQQWLLRPGGGRCGTVC